MQVVTRNCNESTPSCTSWIGYMYKYTTVKRNMHVSFVIRPQSIMRYFASAYSQTYIFQATNQHPFKADLKILGYVPASEHLPKWPILVEGLLVQGRQGLAFRWNVKNL